MKLSSCCRLKELQQATPGTKILAPNLCHLLLKYRKIVYPRLKLHTDKFSEQADKTEKSSQEQEAF